jgi:hypothetical protein
MTEILHLLERHGYLVLFAAIIGRQAGLPVPANLLLVAGGTLARGGKSMHYPPAREREQNGSACTNRCKPVHRVIGGIAFR